ncbi:MAG: hypothetical protein HYU25_17050 [Candidatus Rokubacteria bacterium]|nr:hypothetical protein [Candidatus Rokubacteria bacterium]
MSDLRILAREMRALKGGPISAFLIFLIAFGLGFAAARMIYKDTADFWMKRAGQADRASASGAPQAASDKELKLRVREFIEAASEFRESEMRQWAIVRHATATVVNTIDPGLGKCSALQRDALWLRGELLRRVPTIHRDSTATAAYESSDCLKALPVILRDLRVLAEKLPG